MKNFSTPRQENPSGSPKSMDYHVLPQLSRGAFENVRLTGRHVGASMIRGGGGGGSGEPPGSCSLNIYINNDIQGINNSLLIGSEVTMGDPGVCLNWEGLTMDRGFRLVSKKKERDSVTWLLLVASLMLVIAVLAYTIM